MSLRDLERVLDFLERVGEVFRRIECIMWEQECRFEGRHCLEYKLTCMDTRPVGGLLRGGERAPGL